MLYNGYTKTQLKEFYGLTEKEIAEIPFRVDSNGFGYKVYLYHKEDIEACCIKHYGSVAAARQAAAERRESPTMRGKAAAAKARREAAQADAVEIRKILGSIGNALDEIDVTSPTHASFSFRVGLLDDELESELKRAGVDMVVTVGRLLEDSRDLAAEFRLAAGRAPDCQHFAFRETIRRQGLCERCHREATKLQHDQMVAADQKLAADAVRVAAEFGFPQLSGSYRQREWALKIRQQFFVDAAVFGEANLVVQLCSQKAKAAKFWIDNRKKTPAAMIALLKPSA